MEFAGKTASSPPIFDTGGPLFRPCNRPGVEQLLRQGRVDFIYPADYREGAELEVTMKNIIRKMAVSHQLAEENARQLKSI